jgi:hypothetical protein
LASARGVDHRDRAGPRPDARSQRADLQYRQRDRLLRKNQNIPLWEKAYTGAPSKKP